jgi:hypothetical protein
VWQRLSFVPRLPPTQRLRPGFVPFIPPIKRPAPGRLFELSTDFRIHCYRANRTLRTRGLLYRALAVASRPVISIHVR